MLLTRVTTCTVYIAHTVDVVLHDGVNDDVACIFWPYKTDNPQRGHEPTGHKVIFKKLVLN